MQKEFLNLREARSKPLRNVTYGVAFRRKLAYSEYLNLKCFSRNAMNRSRQVQRECDQLKISEIRMRKEIQIFNSASIADNCSQMTHFRTT